MVWKNVNLYEKRDILKIIFTFGTVLHVHVIQLLSLQNLFDHNLIQMSYRLITISNILIIV